MRIEFIQDFFRTQGGIVDTKKLKEAGFTHYQLNNLMQSGQVVKVKQGLYQWNEAEQSELGIVARIVPEGICCLFTACQHYELTTFVSSQYHIAIAKKAKVVLPDYPPIQLYYWEEKSYSTGVIEMLVNGIPVRMYDKEKTICDMIRLRNRMGLDTVKEVVKNYLERKDRNLAKLSSYARELGIGQYMSDMIGLLV